MLITSATLAELGLRFSGITPRLAKNSLFRESLEVQGKQTRRFIELSAMKVHPLLLLVITLLFLSGPFVNAGPVGDFFKNVGQSISKPFQREPQPQPQPQPQSTRPPPTKPLHPTRRPTSRTAPATSATPPAAGQPSQPAKEESTGPVRRVSAADLEKAKAGLPYGIPVPGRQGMVTSPYTPEQGKYIDVTGFPSGSIAKDPYTGKLFLVP